MGFCDSEDGTLECRVAEWYSSNDPECLAWRTPTLVHGFPARFCRCWSRSALLHMQVGEEPLSDLLTVVMADAIHTLPHARQPVGRLKLVGEKRISVCPLSELSNTLEELLLRTADPEQMPDWRVCDAYGSRALSQPYSLARYRSCCAVFTAFDWAATVA